MLAAVGPAIKPLNGNFCRSRPSGRSSRGPLRYASPAWSQQWADAGVRAQLPGLQAGQSLHNSCPESSPYNSCPESFTYNQAPMEFHPQTHLTYSLLLLPLYMTPEGTPQSVTQMRTSTSDSSSWEPSFKGQPAVLPGRAAFSFGTCT